MSNYVLTGAPGAGKTAIVRQLEVHGYQVVEEAATDVIALSQALGVAEPWRDAEFADRILALQRRRQLATETADAASITFFDRSPVCTLALTHHLGRKASRPLIQEIDRILAERVYQPAVFFIRNQGFLHRTAARRISFQDSLDFERVHERTYRSLGFELMEVPAAPLPVRVSVVQKAVETPPSGI